MTGSAGPGRGPARTRSERRRRHTLYFLEHAARQRPVHLDTDIDMTRVEAHRAAARAAGRRSSVVAYVLYAAGRVLHRHPEANAALDPGRLLGLRGPRTVRFDGVTAKLALDRTVDGERTVLSALLPGLESAGLDEIQRRIERYRGPDTAGLPEFRGVRLLGRLPVPLGRLAFAAALRDPRRRPAVLGTVSVSSLGHRPVDGFHSSGGTAVTLCAGRVAERPVARDGRLTIAPVMRLGLTFDHRIIDGAAAADVLGDLKTTLEEFDDGAEGDGFQTLVRGAGQDLRT
ncbi:2-oxo acid dehydrogenase subunit E2 [Streptomyces clavuligerus]|uniref:Hydrolase superfamily dihydrolipoamide acyltransferase-like protein n=1 Tax=Streptomyces clavuligerus TaxID=1901 RepID=E2Q9B2_STRCL|nr:2-oxo acid dehydrogenase subunit E2 [Streptomyces clavuligerus]ANW21339.1 acyltransferase [Streptomyces clavuligerus]AXU15965.1 acyltransferase [Streptomyces clavuligerus]EFG05532.1 Hydrolase superfamily dihydrolipoamide acyltransferase-like protein [Streptomyces clavuligerus]MBY6306099.1 2-oxo acid dehydrogenase subunit E2 [Streptomyces clavuligerus]QCS08745.1 acyltransferase [Streptomyces clavuligerus]